MGEGRVIRSLCNAVVEWFCLHILTGFASPSSGFTPCVPLACTITCWLTFLERSLTWFTWKSWACVGTHWWFGLSVTWPTIPQAFRSWLDARLKLATFPTLPAISQRILSGIWAWRATVPILNAGVSSPSLLCFLLLPDGFSFLLICHDFSSSVRLDVVLHPNPSCVLLPPANLSSRNLVRLGMMFKVVVLVYCICMGMQHSVSVGVFAAHPSPLLSFYGLKSPIRLPWSSLV